MVIYEVEQGDILKVENISAPVYVVSNSYFNKKQAVIGCPIVKKTSDSVTHILIDNKALSGYILCEQLRFIDINSRGYKIISHADIDDMVNIVDVVQGFFDFM